MNEIFKVGDRVWCCIYGWGTVTNTKYCDLNHPITVSFDSDKIASYTKDGKRFVYYNRTLFFKEQQFDESKPEPEYEIGYYWVYYKAIKVVAHYGADSKYYCGGMSIIPDSVICKIEEP